MNRKGGLFLSIIILVVVFAVGFFMGGKSGFFDGSGSDSDLESENAELNVQIGELQAQLGGFGESAEENCVDAGGKWGVWGNTPGSLETCNPSTSDAGQVCEDSDECESYCVAPEGAEIGDAVEGECYGWELAVCMKEVLGGEVQATWCL